jgi:hypothetical protein
VLLIEPIYSKFEWLEWGTVLFFFELWGKWHWFARIHVTWALRGTLAVASGHQTSLWSILEDPKTLNCEKKALGSKFAWLFWTLSPYFSTAVKKLHVDLRECLAICCCGSTFLGYVVSDFTKYTIKKICELIMPRATHLSKIQQVWVAGMDFFILFCAERKMALVCRNARNLNTSGDISDR